MVKLKREDEVNGYNAQAVIDANAPAGQPFELAVSMGIKEGYSWVDKFGENPDIDTGTAPEDLWEFGGLYPYDADNTAPIQYVSSSDTLDSGQIIEIQGLDINGGLVTQQITTTGQTNTLLTTPLWRVFRMENQSDFDNNVNGILYCHTDPAPVAGVPLSTSVRAVINNGNNQTQMLVYTVPVGYVVFLRRAKFSISRAQSTGVAQCAYYSRRFGKLFKNKERFNVVMQGNSEYLDVRPNWDMIPAKTDIKITVEEVSANNTGLSGSLQMLLVRQDKLPEELQPLAE